MNKAVSSTTLQAPFSFDLGAAPESLPDDPQKLKEMLCALRVSFQEALAAHTQAQEASFALHVRELEQAHKQALAEQTAAFHQRILEMFEEIRLARRRMFGPSSEVLSAQGRLFDEVEVESADSTAADDVAVLPPPVQGNPATSSGKAPVRRGKRAALPAELPRVEILHDVPLAERTCPCGTAMVEIGTEVSEQLDIVPMQVRVLRHVRKRYACPRGEHAPVVAPAPKTILPRSNASAGLLATLIVAKYVDGLPLARLEYVLARHGVKVPRQTLARWMIGCAQKLIALVNLLRDTLLDGSVIHMDETTVQVLKELGRAASSKSFMWVQRGGPPGQPVILFDYDPSRSGQIPVRHLDRWCGYLMTDGYDGYNALAGQPGIEHLVCWAHVRRKFMDAAKALPAGKRGHAHHALELIGQLYAIERDCRALSDAERAAQRQARGNPILAQLRSWLDAVSPGVPPQTVLGRALRYMHDFWSKLVRYTERGDLPIDNNPAENAIRPFVIGRKNWLFADTPAGAVASATLYSLLETAKANSIEPYVWLRHVLSRLPHATSLQDYEALLPWNLRGEHLTANFIP